MYTNTDYSTYTNKKKCIPKISYILYIVCKTGLILLYLMMNNFSNIILADIITNY